MSQILKEIFEYTQKNLDLQLRRGVIDNIFEFRNSRGNRMAKQILTRDEVPEHLTWDLTTIFESDEAWEAELKKWMH